MQMMQMDPRYMDIFKELTGIDLGNMQENMARGKDREEANQKVADELNQERKAE